MIQVKCLKCRNYSIFSKLLSLKQESGQLIRKHAYFPQRGKSARILGLLILKVSNGAEGMIKRH